jgi:hypothetical protein
LREANLRADGTALGGESFRRLKSLAAGNSPPDSTVGAV